MQKHKTIVDVLMDINTPEAAKKFIVITDHENSFYFSYPGEDDFESLKGEAFLTRTFIPFSISVHDEVGSHFIYKWDTMNDVLIILTYSLTLDSHEEALYDDVSKFGII